MNTFRGDLELAALGNLDGLDGLVVGASLGVLDLLDEFVALEDFAEDDMAAIEPSVTLLASGLLRQLMALFYRLTR